MCTCTQLKCFGSILPAFHVHQMTEVCDAVKKNLGIMFRNQQTVTYVFFSKSALRKSLNFCKILNLRCDSTILQVELNVTNINAILKHSFLLFAGIPWTALRGKLKSVQVKTFLIYKISIVCVKKKYETLPSKMEYFAKKKSWWDFLDELKFQGHF